MEGKRNAGHDVEDKCISSPFGCRAGMRAGFCRSGAYHDDIESTNEELLKSWSDEERAGDDGYDSLLSPAMRGLRRFAGVG